MPEDCRFRVVLVLVHYLPCQRIIEDLVEETGCAYSNCFPEEVVCSSVLIKHETPDLNYFFDVMKVAPIRHERCMCDGV